MKFRVEGIYDAKKLGIPQMLILGLQHMLDVYKRQSWLILCVMLVVCFSGLVYVHTHFPTLFLGHSKILYTVSDSCVKWGVDIDAKEIFSVAHNIITASSYHYAWTLVYKILQHTFLNRRNFIPTKVSTPGNRLHI